MGFRLYVNTLLAAYNYLKSKPIILIWKVVLVLSFIFAASDTSSVSGLNVFPRVPILFMKTVYIQDWLLYEILQPYLCRVQFKPWEERAWFEKYQTELYGFIVGTWIICTIPWIGVAALPFMFPAVAFLLTKSCGSMENSSQGRTSSATRTGMGDLIEQRSPGVKLVAQGTHPAVRGDWEGHKVLTMIQSDPEYLHQAIKDFKPEEHNIPWKNSALHYSVDNIHREEVTKEEIEEDRKCSLLRREALYQEAEREAVARHFHNSHSQHRANHGYGRFGGFGGFGRPESFGLGPPGRFGNGSPPMMMWDMHMDPRFSTEYSGHSSLSAISLPSAPPPEASASSSSASPLSAPTLLSHSPPTTIQDHASEPIVTTSTATTITAIVKEDLTRYNFSDRKTLDSAPSAPFEEDIVQSPISDTLLSESNYINANFREGGQNSMDSEIHSTHSLTKRKRPTIQAENEIQAEDQDLNEEQDEAGTTGRVRKEENSLQCLSTNRRGGFGSPRSGRGRGGFGFGHRKSREDNMEDNNNTIDTNEGRRRGIGAFRGFMQSVAKRHQDHRDHRHHGGFYRTQSQNQRQGHHQGNKLDVDEHAQRYDHHYPHLYRSRSSPIHSSHLTSTDDVSPPTTTTAAFTTTTTSTPESSNSEHSIGSGTVTGSSDLLNFSDALLYGLSHLEQHLNQRMQAWGHQWFQKVREAITDPNHPSVFRYQRE
ncbi:hypothetical protein FBU30_008050 [Linnemannia zychae]|nr:hypothetical protein FBU30_008050 [Linnemannia zychae]